MRASTIVASIVVVGAAAGATLLLSQGSQAEEERPERRPATAALEVRDLVEREDFQGNLVYDESTTLSARGSGVLLGILDEGEVARRGDRLFDIQGSAVRLLYGTSPMWRDLHAGVSDGRDVAQLERNLVAMGFDPYDAIDVDRDFDSATTAALQRWEDELGVTEDGILLASEVVFSPGPLRVGEHRAEVGTNVGPGTPVAEASSPRQIVAMDLPADRRSIVARGKKVTVQLPDGDEVRGRISSVGAVAQAPAEQGGEPTIEVEVEMLGKGGGFDQAPVEITIETGRLEDALAAPVTALLALAEGGYALEVVEGTSTNLVPVELGSFASGWVEVSGQGLTEGTEVVISE